MVNLTISRHFTKFHGNSGLVHSFIYLFQNIYLNFHFRGANKGAETLVRAYINNYWPGSSDLLFVSKYQTRATKKPQLRHTLVACNGTTISLLRFAILRPCHDTSGLLEKCSISRCATTSQLRTGMVESFYVFDCIRLCSVCPGKEGGKCTSSAL